MSRPCIVIYLPTHRDLVYLIPLELSSMFPRIQRNWCSYIIRLAARQCNASSFVEVQHFARFRIGFRLTMAQSTPGPELVARIKLAATDTIRTFLVSSQTIRSEYLPIHLPSSTVRCHQTIHIISLTGRSVFLIQPWRMGSIPCWAKSTC
ncbi:hypothetical protein BO78DRAFT_133741 [Aspergillus sclerotiicarbonarius CBS 121057]|uniref:Uncharacterized protein n=1 Tax=Aspergillus sclerotiicarbonarius (strain CBS 121057 / IBT 28362) TaxID=1448318 RepID=A0A319EMD6_ASPSB|nr:hypothetical protein BO78DRAFT_133741 [Aspergillus sclerotiicarbonarius CBS 121057]